MPMAAISAFGRLQPRTPYPSPTASGTFATGEGNYEGLSMHRYITGTNYDFALAG